MAIVLRSGLVALVRSVRAYLELEGVGARVSVGWTKRTRQDNQGEGTANRIVFVPGDPQNGRNGTLHNAKFPGPRDVADPSDPTKRIGAVRELRNWERVVTMSVWAAPDPNAEDAEESQIEETDALFEWALRGVHRFGFAAVEWGDVGHTVEPVEVSHGRELLATFTLSSPIFDKPVEVARPDRIEITKSLPAEIVRPGFTVEG